MSDDIKYVQDAHGHVYIFVPAYHTERIGNGLEFVEAPAPVVFDIQARVPRTLQELREVASKQGFDIPDETPFAKAQNMYAEFLAAPINKEVLVDNELSGFGVFDDISKPFS